MRYRAFISYSNSDREIGERFQRAIEHYSVPKPLRDKDYGFGPIPKHITPLFRDRTDGQAGADLAEALREALEASDALVLLCSPASAQSKWCNEEIRIFKRLGREARILPVLVDGTPRSHDPATAPDGAFPPALFERYDTAGKLATIDTSEPLAADLRDTGDGLRFARLKVVSALTGVPLTLLTQREQEAERRGRLIARSVAAGMSVLAIVATISAIFAWRSEQAAQTRLQKAIEMATGRVNAAAKYQDIYGVPSDVIRDLLDGAEKDFGSLVDTGDGGAPMLKLERGRMLALFSGHYGALGDGARQLELAREGLRTLESTPTSRSLFQPSTWVSRLPTDRTLELEKLSAIEALGLALEMNEDSLSEAKSSFELGRTLAERLDEPLRVARFWSRTGELRYFEGDLEGALVAQDSALAALAKAVARGGPDAGEARRDEAVARTERAETLLELGRHADALAEQTAAATALGAEAGRLGPADSSAQQVLAQAIARRGDMKYAVSGDWTGSIPDFEQAIAILDQIHGADPARIDYARDLSIALERLGDARLQRDELGKAQTAYDRCIQLRREILARNAGSSDARRDVAVALERMGDLALGRKRPADALGHFDEARALRTASVEDVDEPDTVLIRDMAVLKSKTAQARHAAGGRRDWKEMFEGSIADMKPLLEEGDAPAGWLRDVAVFHAVYGDALEKSGERRTAVAEWTSALDLINQQLALDPDDPRLRSDQETLRRKIRQSS